MTARRLACFDLDHTLIPLDSDVLWTRELVSMGVVDEAWYAHRNEHFFEQYKAGTLDIQEFLAFQLSPLAANRRADLEVWRESFLSKHFGAGIRPEAVELVERHRARGDELILITATNEFVTRPLADRFGIDHLIATRLERTPDGEYTGRPEGVPSFREGKVVRLMQWLADRGESFESYEQVTFYSDSLNDLPLLLRVSHPVATNPDDTLRAHAQASGWPILDLFPELQASRAA